MNKCGTWSTANLSFLGRKMCKGRRAISAYTISTHVQVINLQEAPGKAAPEHCVHYRSQELQRCCKFLSAETSDCTFCKCSSLKTSQWVPSSEHAAASQRPSRSMAPGWGSSLPVCWSQSSGRQALASSCWCHP